MGLNPQIIYIYIYKTHFFVEIKNFLIYSTEDTYLMKYPEKELTEETLINMAKEYISEYIQDVNYDNYIYECETALIKSGEKGAWKENIPMFYHSNKADEKIWEYDLNYREYCNGLATGNLISVDFDGAGNIVRLGYYDYDVDWSSVSADQSIVKESITDFLNKYVRTKYQISGYEIRSQALTCIEGKVCLSLGVGVSFLYNNDEYEMLIPLILEI